MKALQTIKSRLSEPTPSGWKIIRKIAATIALFSVMVVGLEAHGYHVPELVTAFLNFWTAAGGVIMTFLTSLPSVWRDDFGEIDEEKKTETLRQQHDSINHRFRD